MSKYKIVPVEPDDSMAQRGLWAMDAWHMEAPAAASRLGAAKICYRAMLAAAPAPVASAEDVERVAQVIHDAEKASFIRNGGAWIGSTPDGRHYEQARAALRAMGYEVEG